MNWSLDPLPRWTVVGLKHSINQQDKKLTWQGAVLDPIAMTTLHLDGAPGET